MDGVVVYEHMNPDFLLKLDACRHEAGVPMPISSSYRSWKKNIDVGGSSASMHLYGRAVDVRVSNSINRAKIIFSALRLGLTVGVMENGLHIDDRVDGPIVFTYYDKYVLKSSLK